MKTALLRRLVPVLLVSVILILYGLTRSEVHTFDALSYVRDVNTGGGFFFHPHHLFYSPTGWLFWRAWQLVGYGGDAAVPLAVLNMLAGAVCAGVLYRLVVALTDHVPAGLIAAGLLAFNAGVWYFAVETEVYLLALVWLVLALVMMVQLVTEPRRWTAPALGLMLGLAALYHQTNGLLALVVVVAACLRPGPWRARLAALLRSGVVAALVVTLGYGVVMVGVLGYRSVGEMRSWLFFFIETGWWGAAAQNRWLDLGAGLGKSISSKAALGWWLGVVIVLALGLPRAARRWGRVVAVALSWLVIYGAFFTWWEPNNVEFWIATLLPLWLLVGLSSASLRPAKLRPVGNAVALVGVIWLAWHNFGLIERRGNAQFDLQRRFAAGVRANSAPGDLVVTPGGVLELYLPYYEQRTNIVTLNALMQAAQGNAGAALDKLRGAIEQARQAGYGVIVDQGMWQLPPELGRRFNIPQAQLDAFWQPYRSELQLIISEKGEPVFWQLPAANTYALGAGWRWQHTLLGWQVQNARDVGLDQALCFGPEVDPMLISPLLDVDAAQWQAVEISLSTQAQEQVAQLFYADAAGAISAERSLTWAVPGDGHVHTYTLPLNAAVGWTGRITRLRLDPIALGDGTAASQTCVAALRLVAR